MDEVPSPPGESNEVAPTTKMEFKTTGVFLCKYIGTCRRAGMKEIERRSGITQVYVRYNLSIC
jgi:hypothetical protein